MKTRITREGRKQVNEIKSIMGTQGLSQRDILRSTKVNPTSLSLFVNLIRPLPEKHLSDVARVLGVSESKLTEPFTKKK